MTNWSPELWITAVKIGIYIHTEIQAYLYLYPVSVNFHISLVSCLCMSDYLSHLIIFCFLSYMQVRQKHLMGKSCIMCLCVLYNVCSLCVHQLSFLLLRLNICYMNKYKCTSLLFIQSWRTICSLLSCIWDYHTFHCWWKSAHWHGCFIYRTKSKGYDS